MGQQWLKNLWREPKKVRPASAIIYKNGPKTMSTLFLFENGEGWGYGMESGGGWHEAQAPSHLVKNYKQASF